MARKPSGNPPGRPVKEIDWSIFESLCSIQCTQSEIASVLKIHMDTLRDRAAERYGEEYSSVYKKYSETGKSSLRRAQFKLAMTNTSMAIWLGKQWLDQKDTSAKDLKDATKEGVIDAIRELEGLRSRDGEASRPALEAQSSILDKECSRKKNAVQNELGSEGII